MNHLRKKTSGITDIFSISFFVFFFCSFFSFGEELTPVLRFNRIISFSPPATEQIFLLGAEDRLIACTTYCIRPTQAEKKVKIGSLRDLNMEKIIALAPDLVIASSLTKPMVVKKLNDFGIKTVTFKSPPDFKTLLKQFVELGELIGEKDKAAKIAKDSEGKIDRIKVMTSGFSKKPKAIFQVGSKPMYLSGNDSFVGDFIKSAGGVNILGDKNSGVFSREMIVVENPDVIFMTTMGFAGEEEKKEWQKFKSISAVANSRIFVYDASSICSPNPCDLPLILAEIAGHLFPEYRVEIINCVK